MAGDVAPSTNPVSGGDNTTGGVTASPSVDEAVLFDSMLTADELNNGVALDGETGGWDADISEMTINATAADEMSDVGLCPDGRPVVIAGTAAFMSFDHPASSMAESVMVFERATSADVWVAAFESCVGQAWECCDDPTEYMTMEPIDVAALGLGSSGFLIRSAHVLDGETAHVEAYAIVRLGPTVLVVVSLDSDDVTNPYDPDALNELTAMAAAKIVGELCTVRPDLGCTV